MSGLSLGVLTMGKVVSFAKKKQELIDSGKISKKKYGWRPFCPVCGLDLRETGGVTQPDGQVLCPACHEKWGKDFP